MIAIRKVLIATIVVSMLVIILLMGLLPFWEWDSVGQGIISIIICLTVAFASMGLLKISSSIRDPFDH